MSTMERVFKEIHIEGRNPPSKIKMEKYQNGDEVVSVCMTRTKNPAFPTCKFTSCLNADWDGVKTLDEAKNMLKNGWAEKVDVVKKSMKDTQRKNFSMKNSGLKTDVVGFVPIVPNAILGLPNSMLNTSVKPKKNKVIDIIYGLDFSASVSKDNIIEYGLQVMKRVCKLEAEGFRVRLTCMQVYADNMDEFHIMTVKCKSEDQPLDAQRIMFPMFHTSMFRVIGFGWYETLPESTHLYGYGKPLYYFMSQNQIDNMIEQLFGRTAIYIDGTCIMKEGEKYIDKRLGGKAI